MKPFGVRLAAGAVTILLGALAAAQAQKDQQSKAQSEWEVTQLPSLAEPPAPIQAAISPGWPAPANPTDVSSDDEPPGGADAVRLVQHSQPELPNADTFGNPEDDPIIEFAGGLGPSANVSKAVDSNMGFAIVDSSTGKVESSAAAGPTFGLPADDTASNVTAANARMSLPTMNLPLPDEQAPFDPGAPPTSQSAVQDGPNASAMPELQFEQPPAMNFSDVPGYGAPENSPANDLRDGLPGGDEFADNGFGVSPSMPTDAPLADNRYNASPQPLLRAVQNPNGIAPEQFSEPQFPQQSQPHLVSPNTTPSSQPTLRYAESPNFQDPQASMNSVAHNDLAAAPGLATGHGQPNGFNAVPPQPAAKIASLPQGYAAQNGYAPQLIDGPVAAAPIQPDVEATIASPGDRRLEGIQSPSIVIHKRAPSEVKVGKPASFVIHVQNVGSAEALDVTVHDRIPAGMRLIDASPTPIQQGDALVWQLGAMSIGDERTVTMQLIPEQEGELGSVARVTFEAAASVRTMSTRPELKIVQIGPPKVLIGQQLEIELEVSNPGTGAATGVVLQEDVPDGLEHPKGRQLDNLIGTLAAGEVRRQVLRLRAVTPGKIQNQIRLTGDDGLEAVDTIDVEIVAPQLQLALNGPQRRFLERQATYELDIANVGTADATNVEIAAHLDRGFTFVSTDYEGQYDPNQHTVYWSLANLPQGGNGTVPLTLLPVEEGEQAIRLEARADLGIVAQNERTVAVDALAELTFSINDVSDPIEVGGETIYEIRLTNSGSRNDSNVRVQLQLPGGMSLLGADGDAQEDGRGGVFFEPRAQLAANDEVVYRVRAQGIAPGTHLVKAIVTSDQSMTPVTKEESTMVYSDR